MAEKKLALYGGQLKERELFQQSVDGEPSHCLCLVEEQAHKSADFIILDENTSSEFNRDTSSNQGIILIGKNPGSDLAKEMIRLHPQHILLNPDGDESINFGEVLWACQRKDGLDPTNFMSHSSQKIVRTIQSTLDIPKKIAEVFSQTNLDNLFAGAPEQLELVANELLTNALYNAPLGILGPEFKLLAEQRRLLKLPAPFEVQLQTLSNDKELALVVTDPFGSLTADVLYRYLSKGLDGELNYEDKKGGAGMGMALMRSFCHRMGIKVVKGKETQIICFIEKKKRFKEHQMHCKSMHIFVKE